MTDLNQSIDTIVRAQIAAALEQSSDGKSLMEVLVDSALNGTVKVPGSWGSKEAPFIETKLAEGMQIAVEKAVQSILSERQDEITDLVREKLTPQIDEFAVAIVQGLTGDDWRASLNVRVVREDVDD